MIIEYLVLTLLLLVLYFDLEYRVIPNSITLGFIVFGYFLQYLLGGTPLLLQSILGSVIGFGILLIPYIKGGIGGGDVKLLAAIGSLTPLHFLIQLVLMGILLAFLLSLISLYKNKKLAAIKNYLIGTLTSIHGERSSSELYIPLGACFSIVGIILLFYHYPGGG